MKKIGILTMYRFPNYGALMQCWALKQTCQNLGYDSEILNYYPWGEQKFWFNKTWPSKLIRRYFDLKSFDKFLKERGNLTRFIATRDEIMQNPPCEDIYIAGSDQIWSPKIVEEYLCNYLLDFAPKISLRVSYASSMGGVSYKESEKYFKEELPKFSAISIREPAFIDDLKEISGKEVVDVCDPALLLTAEDYIQIEEVKKFLPKHYIVVYKLDGGQLVNDIAKEIKRETKYPIIGVFGGKNKGYDHTFLSLSPQQWLYVMHNADYISTDSFHGVVFSIIFRRPFVCIGSTLHPEQDERVTNILGQTGLEKQMITNIDEVDRIFSIDYNNANDKIDAYRARSINWLKLALDNASK